MKRTFAIRLVTFALWLFAGGLAVYWGLKFVKGAAVPSAAIAGPSGSTQTTDPLALAKGLGGGLPVASAAPSAAPPVTSIDASRFVLTGVVVQKSSRQGVALIAVDGKPPRPYRVGSALADGVVLHSVSAGKAMLSASADAAPGLTLELPQLTTAMAGTAVAARPAMPAAIPAIPSASPAATPAANPMAALSVPGQRPPRPLANRQREAGKDQGKDAARDQAAQ